MPVFVANAIADYTVFRRQCQPPLDGFDEFSCLDRNDDERLSRQEASVRPSLDAQFMMLDADSSGYLSRDELPEEGMGGAPGYMPPPPELVLMEGTEKWYAHTMSVIRSDPRLQEMAGVVTNRTSIRRRRALQASRHLSQFRPNMRGAFALPMA